MQRLVVTGVVAVIVQKEIGQFIVEMCQGSNERGSFPPARLGQGVGGGCVVVLSFLVVNGRSQFVAQQRSVVVLFKSFVNFPQQCH